MNSSFEPKAAYELLAPLAVPWWVAGGWAIDLSRGRQTRHHEDLDIAILTRDQDALWTLLSDWNLWTGHGDGPSEPWTPDSLVAPNTETPVWCRSSPDAPWAFEVLLSDATADQWVFKRNSAVRRPIAEIGAQTPEGIPYLRPEVVLLFKAKGMREQDAQDFNAAHEDLPDDARTWLRESLEAVHPGHPWIETL